MIVIEPTITIRMLYTNRRRAYYAVQTLGHSLGDHIYRTVAVHPLDGVYIRVTLPERLEREARAILSFGDKVDALPDPSDCVEFYQGSAVTAFRSQRRSRKLEV